MGKTISKFTDFSPASPLLFPHITVCFRKILFALRHMKNIKNENVTGVYAFLKVEQVSDINVIHQEQYPGNVHLSTSHTFLTLLSPGWFLTVSIYMHMPCQLVICYFLFLFVWLFLHLGCFVLFLCFSFS